MMLMLTMPMTTTSSPTRRHHHEWGIDLDKRIVKLHLEPAVRSGSVRGLGRHHAGDQRHLDMHSGQGEGVSHQVFLIVQVIRDTLCQDLVNKNGIELNYEQSVHCSASR